LAGRLLGALVRSSSDQPRVITQLDIINNGAVFTQPDWERLSTIASGNPDSSKIGMFGV
jgi:hypothetical protein